MKMALRNVLLRNILRLKRVTSILLVKAKYSSHDGNKNYEYSKYGNSKKTISTVLFGTALIASSLKGDDKNRKCPWHKEKEKVEAGAKRLDLPIYSAEEVSKHDTKESFWVTYKNGVYDVTSFLPSHPGGEQILNAGGLSIEPFWNVYGMHKTEEILKLLESFRIGNLHEDDIVDHTDDELWVKEPYRSKELIVKTAKPFNAEIPPEKQVEHFDTPNEYFYVRQHMPVPDLDADKHTLKITVKGSDGEKSIVLSRAELQQFKEVSVRATLMCAGNRRSEMNKVKPVKGINWQGGAISNAVWTGVYLLDLFKHVGLDLEDVDGKHVIFTGSDMDATGVQFSTSIPLWMAVDPEARVLVAWAMNGQPLPPDHGHPLRAVVPGAPAVRSVKWLESITVSTDESSSHWHQKDYRSFNPSKTWETADFATAPPVYSLPVTSAICTPRDGDTVQVVDGMVELKGYAYSGGGARILRVDVSGDGGRSWREALLTAQDPAPHRRHYAWTLWGARLPVEPGQTQIEVWVKATDGNFNTQPEKFDDIWNIRGILSNAYHKIKINLKH